MLRLPPRAVDYLPRALHRDRDRVYNRVRRGPRPHDRCEAQAQGTEHRQCHAQFRERRVDRARQHALHLGRFGLALRARVWLLRIRKVTIYQPSPNYPTTWLKMCQLLPRRTRDIDTEDVKEEQED